MVAALMLVVWFGVRTGKTGPQTKHFLEEKECAQFKQKGAALMCERVRERFIVCMFNNMSRGIIEKILN